MKKNPIIVIKNVFCSITVVWSAIMLIEYIMVLMRVNISGLMFEIFGFLFIFLLQNINRKQNASNDNGNQNDRYPIILCYIIAFF